MSNNYRMVYALDRIHISERCLLNRKNTEFFFPSTALHTSQLNLMILVSGILYFKTIIAEMN